ncbi:MAG: serine hydrolase [Gemmatimonadetes bacterium]|nr:serine hydrolase [Gemmatimonadota bacterium]
MLRPIVRAIVLLGLLAGTPAAAQTGQFNLEKTKTVLTGLIETAIRERGVPSISIALVRGDSIVWKAAFGYANVRTKTPATPETIYSTGSTFKSATATGLLQLLEQKKLDLDAPVNQYLGNIQVQDRLQSDKPVTTRHILSHWSGLNAGAVTKPLWGRELPKALEQMVSGLYSIRAPEAKWEYNNFAFGLAGLLLENISGTEYEKYLIENILKPLGVATPHPVYPSAEMVELMALPYNAGGATGKPVPVAQVHFDVYPAGDIYLTAEDMARFLAMHLNGGTFRGKRIISEASAKLAHEPPYGGTYGFGWSVRKESSGHTIISHSGGIPGQSSYMMGDVDAKVGVYYMSNSGAPPAIGEAALKLLRGEEYVPPVAVERKAITVDPKVLDRYVGTYNLGVGISLVVTREGAGLVLRQHGSDAPMALLPETATTFFVRGQELIVTFVAGPTGAIDKLVVGSGASALEAKRSQ